MKHIVIEGGDNLGKDTLIKGIWEHYSDENWIFRHFGKPPKGMSPQETLDFQFNVFYNEFIILEQFIDEMEEWSYYPNNFLWNRSHLGEYVYSQMFRGISRQDIRRKIKVYEEKCFQHARADMYLITLSADPYFFLSKEDGDSFSQNLEQKTRELELFGEVHRLSRIPNKKIVKVDFDGEFRTKESILKSVTNFIDGREESN
jgi:hypothetical protein